MAAEEVDPAACKNKSGGKAPSDRIYLHTCQMKKVLNKKPSCPELNHLADARVLNSGQDGSFFTLFYPAETCQ